MKAISNKNSSSKNSKQTTTTVTETIVKAEKVVGQKKVTIVAGVAKSVMASASASLAASLGGAANALASAATKSGDKNNKNAKGLIMEQDQDGLEFLSDDEQQMHSSEPNFEEMHIDHLPKIKTKSEQVSTDHSKVYYRPFRKNFYVEVPELAKMTPEEVEACREELEGIKVCLPCVRSFGIELRILENKIT